MCLCWLKSVQTVYGLCVRSTLVIHLLVLSVVKLYTTALACLLWVEFVLLSILREKCIAKRKFVYL